MHLLWPSLLPYFQSADGLWVTVYLSQFCHGLCRCKHRSDGIYCLGGDWVEGRLLSYSFKFCTLPNLKTQNIAMCAILLCINALHLLTHLHQHAIALTEQNSFNLHSAMCNSHLYCSSFWCPSSYRSLSQGSTNSNMLDVQGGAHKKRARRSSLLNAKKLYEDAQMARKVKQYLSSLDVDTDEEKFQMMSLQWEPAYGTCKYRFSLNVKE